MVDNEQVDEILKQGPKGKGAPPEAGKTQPAANKFVPEKKTGKYLHGHINKFKQVWFVLFRHILLYCVWNHTVFRTLLCLLSIRALIFMKDAPINR